MIHFQRPDGWRVYLDASAEMIARLVSIGWIILDDKENE